MKSLPAFRGRAAVLALTLFASLLSCGREITGPGGPGALAQLNFAPSYGSMIDEVNGVMHSVAGLVPFTQVRIELRRVDNSVAAVRLVDFPAASTEMSLSIEVRLGNAATSEGEVLTAFIKYINAAGDTVFSGGPVSVVAQARTNSQDPPVEIPILPTVPGGIFARLEISPDTLIALSGTPTSFTATGYDAQENVVANAIVGFISRNPAIVAVPNLGSGEVNLVGTRGTTWLVAQSLTGLKDSAFVRVLPRPASLTKISGDAQTAVQGQAFAQPLRVRVLASDNLPVANWPVGFVVTTGSGSLNLTTVNTDVDGFAEVTWTAGTPLGAASVTVGVTGPFNAVFTGTQVSALPTSMTYVTQPTNITAGASLSNIQVEVRNGANQVMTSYAGSVTLGLTGGTAGAGLVGTTTVGAVAGVATFSGITVNRGGTNYRLLVGTGALAPTQSNTFNVANAPATTITVVSGGGQSAPPSTALADSVRVRVTDTFGFPVVGQAVQFTVTQGDGTLSSATGNTDADGRTAVLWTLGATGAQQMRTSVGALEQFVSASIVAGGSVSLFAGFDYTLARVGGQKMIPIFLTNPSPTPIEVSLSVNAAGAGIISWPTPTVQIGIGITRIDVPINGLTLGSAWAIMTSAVGNDSVFVTVDSSFVQLLETQQATFLEGDTVRTIFRLSEPAPAGGLMVVVRSLNPSVATVAPSAGTGAPQPSCIAGNCFSVGDVRAGLVASAPMIGSLLAAPADTAAVFVPAGQVYGEVAVLLINDGGEGTSVSITVEADGFVGDALSFGVWPQSLYGYTDSFNTPTLGIGVGQTTTLQFYAQVRSLKPQVVHLESRNPSAVAVDSIATIRPNENYSVNTEARVLSADSTWVRYWMDAVAVDSFLIRGDVPVLRMTANTTLPELGETYVTVDLTSVLNPGSTFRRATPLSISVGSDNPSVAEVDRSALYFPANETSAAFNVRMMSAGTANIIISAPGHVPDTLQVGTTTPSVYYNFDTGFLGENQLLDAYVELTYEQVLTGPRTVNVQSLDSSIVQVVTPRLEIGRDYNGGTVRLRGVQSGTATIRFSGPGIATTDASITVTSTSPYLSALTSYPPDALERTVTTFIWDTFSVRPMASTVTGVLRSSDPTIVQVTDSLLEFTPASSYDYTGTIRPLAPGAATLWFVRPGVDSVSYSTTVEPYAITAVFPASVVGRRMQEDFALWRAGPDTLESAITITHSGPGLVSFSNLPAAFSTGILNIDAEMVGVTAGVDTLTIAVAGYPPVTQVVTVASSGVSVSTNGSTEVVGVVDNYYYNGFAVAGGATVATPGTPIRLLVTSLDTARVEILQDTIEWAVGDSYQPTRFASVHYKTPGLVSIGITDIDGILAGDTLEFYVYPAELFGSTYSGVNATSIAMGQHTDAEEIYVERGASSATPLWVRLTSTNPTLVQVPDSVLIPADDYYTYFNITAGDTTGSARIVATAPGYNPWQFDVLVTRGQFEVYAGEAYLDGGSLADVYVVDAVTLVARSMVNPFAARFATSTPTTLSNSGPTFTFPADSFFTVVRGPQGVAVGSGQMGVEDDRGAIFQRVLAGWTQVDVRQPTVYSFQRRLLLTPGLTSEDGGARFATSSGKDSVWVHVADLQGRFQAQQDSLLLVDSNAGPLIEEMGLSESGGIPLRGLTLGRDTLVVSANAMRSDTVLVDVVQGVLRLGSTMPRIEQGDSVLVLLNVFDGAGSTATAAEAIGFSVSINASFVTRQNGIDVSTVSLLPGQSTLAFWVRAVASGDGALTLTHTNFRTFTINLSAIGSPE